MTIFIDVIAALSRRLVRGKKSGDCAPRPRPVWQAYAVVIREERRHHGTVYGWNAAHARTKAWHLWVCNGGHALNGSVEIEDLDIEVTEAR